MNSFIPLTFREKNAAFKRHTDKLPVILYMMMLCIYPFELWSKVIIKTLQKGNKITEKVEKRVSKHFITTFKLFSSHGWVSRLSNNSTLEKN